ncbi:unnamed protein product [Vitrella brassicaformis CCMP3155]|uniref:Uncharacterized protein n=1 Tax=Vitrella brassicaformis (strain CCMP3155) TaxID=1169540 RepID=A0A0G4EJ69_VITBC|nr:unnamed protein product [Vitrella brassicaformis CCMP3155]|eukprot:CEL95955.1 unnamed protein product [Vitrella brassicaformis CCMP3155]
MQWIICSAGRLTIFNSKLQMASASVFGQRGAMAAAASSSSAAADLSQPQMLPSSHERYKTGTRVWMVTANREKGQQVYVKADVYRTEETGGRTRVSMREVEGREDFTVVVPHQATASPHGHQMHEGFTLVERAPRNQSDGDTAGQHVGLFDLPPDVERDVVFALLGPDGLAGLRRTCTLGSQRVSEAYVKTQIDAQLVAKGLKNILSYDLPSVGHLLRLLHIIQQSGEWAATVPIVRVAVHQRRGGGKLPIELTSADVEGVGSRAVFEGRCEALRQLSLIQRHIGIPLERDSNGLERLDGHRLTIRPLLTLPANHPFRNGYDEANPVCQSDGIRNESASVRDVVLDRMGFGGSKVTDHRVQRHDPTRYNRLRQLATQPPPIWGCHTISTNHIRALGDFNRMILLHGGQPDDTFEAHIYIYISSDTSSDLADVYLYTTERPVIGVGAARFPETMRVVRQAMGADDIQVAFGSQLVVEVD